MMGTPVDDPLRWKAWFEERGFENAVDKRYKVPCNPWPRDPRLKLVGAFEMDNLMTNLVGLSMYSFRKLLGWSQRQVEEYASAAKKDIKNRRCHSYWP
jgi:hypothetical protein